jgi:very-short-patch-repair endonuclease
VVFASFPPNLIDLNRTSAEAVRDLKHFLEYAERGPRALGEAVAGSVGGFESPFEQAVARGLRERGWTVVPQIGVSRFRIDLGVVHPDRPGDYLAGVECDGASYHRAATARDRDKVRENVLKGLGWSLVRVWSTDWWIDRRSALDRLVSALEGELEASRLRLQAKAELTIEPSPELDLEAVLAEPTIPEAGGDPEWSVEPGGDYRVTDFQDLADRLDGSRFQDPTYTPLLRELIARVVAREGPIRDGLLVERVARAHDIRRNGRLIRERVLSIARGAAHLQAEGPGGATFVWPDAQTSQTWSRARYPARTTDVRQVEDISLLELGAALRDCASEDPEAEAARRFGVRRLSTAARTRLARAKPPQGHFAQ